jgi:hypothetical protein
VIDAARTFLGHSFGLSMMGFAFVAAGLLAAWITRRTPGVSPARVIVAAATPMPVVLAIGTAALLAISPWDDPLIGAVLLTVGMFGTLFSLLVGLIAAALVVRWVRP